jgi:hypothetical protein
MDEYMSLCEQEMGFGCVECGAQSCGLDGRGYYLDEVVRLRDRQRGIPKSMAQIYSHLELLVVRHPWLSVVSKKKTPPDKLSIA